MNIDGWLRERGLEYQATFRDNAITEKVREARPFCGQGFRRVRRNKPARIGSGPSLRLACAIDSCRRVNRSP
jgi:hypothetical protein